MCAEHLLIGFVLPLICHVPLICHIPIMCHALPFVPCFLSYAMSLSYAMLPLKCHVSSYIPCSSTMSCSSHMPSLPHGLPSYAVAPHMPSPRVCHLPVNVLYFPPIRDVSIVYGSLALRARNWLYYVHV